MRAQEEYRRGMCSRQRYRSGHHGYKARGEKEAAQRDFRRLQPGDGYRHCAARTEVKRAKDKQQLRPDGTETEPLACYSRDWP